jgi:hypothetical protein
MTPSHSTLSDPAPHYKYKWESDTAFLFNSFELLDTNQIIDIGIVSWYRRRIGMLPIVVPPNYYNWETAYM